MTTVGSTAAWYPDPADATLMRWWDGLQWTANTRSNAGPSMVASTATGHSELQGINLHGTASKGLNHYSLMTLGVGALYLVIAFVTHFVLVGFVPLAMAMRAKRASEPLARLALIAAVGVILFSLKILFRM